MSPARTWPLRTRFRTRSIVVLICIAAAVRAATLNAANDPVPAVAAKASAPAPRRGEPCWSKDEPEHPDVKRQVLKLAEGLERRRVARTDSALRVCVRDDGSVERTILLVSSGSDGVDRSFRDQAMKWKFKPLQINGKPVRSAGDVALSWQY